MQQRIYGFWNENKGILVFLLLMCVFRSSLADWNHVPTGSMKPNIVEGDRILINKIAYDLHAPFSAIKLSNFADPKRGEIIIFNSEVSDKRLVKRVIGLPGDIVSMSNNVLTINGETLQYQLLSESENSVDLTENLFGQQYSIRLRKRSAKAASFASVVVPDNAYLALGDNRDNSVDSRFIGFVPRHEIIGRSKQVVMSLDRENFYLPRKERFLKPL